MMEKKVVSFNCQEAHSLGIDPNRPISYAQKAGIAVHRIHYSSYGAMYFMEVDGVTDENKGVLQILSGTWESLKIETL